MPRAEPGVDVERLRELRLVAETDDLRGLAGLLAAREEVALAERRALEDGAGLRAPEPEEGVRARPERRGERPPRRDDDAVDVLGVLGHVEHRLDRRRALHACRQRRMALREQALRPYVDDVFVRLLRIGSRRGHRERGGDAQLAEAG